MIKEDIKGNIEDMTIDNQIQNYQNNLPSKNDIYSEENSNKIFKENNIEVLKPVPLKNPIYLNKKRAHFKGIFQKNNFYNFGRENGKNCAFQSVKYFDNSKMVAQLPNKDFMKAKNDYFNFNNFNKKKSKKLHKSLQIKINVIINNYINIDNPIIKEDEKKINIKKPIFSIITNKMKFKEKYQNKTEENSLQINNPKKYEIFKINNLDENDDNLEYNEIKKFHKNKKRGRKAKVEGKRQHNAFDQDNIIRKIQVHFLSFIIYFSNDLILAVFPNAKNLSFKNIHYELKKTVNHSYIENLKSKNIGDILQLKASPKNKKFNENINKLTFEYICKINPFLKKFFEISYLDMFNNYYSQNERELYIKGYKVILSERTRLFNDLISKNLSSASKLKEIAKEYFNNKNNLSPIFLVKK
jgi:hypothetical protein